MPEWLKDWGWKLFVAYCLVGLGIGQFRTCATYGPVAIGDISALEALKYTLAWPLLLRSDASRPGAASSTACPECEQQNEPDIRNCEERNRDCLASRPMFLCLREYRACSYAAFQGLRACFHSRADCSGAGQLADCMDPCMATAAGCHEMLFVEVAEHGPLADSAVAARTEECNRAFAECKLRCTSK